MKRFLKRFWFPILLVLFFGPFLIPVNSSGTQTKEQAAETLWGNESKWIEIADHEVHYVTAGDPKSDNLIILMHGFGASAFSYKQILEPLSKVGFVVAYDRAAFGFTERPTTWSLNPYGFEGQMAVLDGMVNNFGEGNNVYVVGHSAGGSLAASYAVENQSKLTGLVLFAPAVLTTGGSPEWLNFILSLPPINHVGPLLVAPIATNGLDILYDSYFNRNNVTQETLDGYTAPLKINGWERAFWEFNLAPRDTSIKDRITEIRIPTVVITGDTDRIVPTADSIQVSKMISGSELVVIPRAGHLANEERPSEFSQALIEFITT